ncbi:hypothetical protein DFH28DRAFT_929541 [Melampsora americana]|nr:hypothetical protein DFH28DRAFT_929541 [Melampsora americana]
MSDNESFDFNAAKDVANKLETVTAEYISADGSNGRTLAEVRSQFSEIVPYDKPNWYRQWSKFATGLINLDKDNGRPVHQNDGPVPTGPVLSDNDPVFVFDLSSNPTFPDDIVVDKRKSRDRGSQHSNRGSQQVHILTQKEIDMAQTARNLLDAQNQRDGWEEKE